MSAQPGYPAVEIDPQPSQPASTRQGSGRSQNVLAQLWGTKAGRFALAAGCALVILVLTLARQTEPEEPKAKTTDGGGVDPLLTDAFAGMGSGLPATSVPEGGSFDFGGQLVGGDNGGLEGGFTPEGEEIKPTTPSNVTVIVQPAQPVAPAPPNTTGAGATPGPGKPSTPVARKRGFYRAGLGEVVFHDGKGGAPVPVKLTEADRQAINSTWAQVKKTKRDQRFKLRGHTLTMNEQGSFAPV